MFLAPHVYMDDIADVVYEIFFNSIQQQHEIFSDIYDSTARSLLQMINIH